MMVRIYLTLWNKKGGMWHLIYSLNYSKCMITNLVILTWQAVFCHWTVITRQPTSPHNCLHRWYWMPQLHTWQPLSMCCENSVMGRSENSLHQERTHDEWFFSQHMLSGCCVSDWHIQYHHMQYIEDCKIRMIQDLWLQLVGELCALKSLVTVDHKLLNTYCKHHYHIHHQYSGLTGNKA